MRILVLKDKKPGHYRQSEAIALELAALMGGGAFESARIKPRFLAHNAVRRLLARAPLSPAMLLGLVYGLAMPDLGPDDVVVASGRPTILAGIAIARATGARFIYRGPAWGYPLGDITLLLVAEPESADGVRRLFVPTPTPVDADMLLPPRPIHAAADLADRTAALLLGGDSHDHRFTADDWDRLLALVAGTAERFGLTWRITSSRRTPPVAADAFAALAVTQAQITFVDYRTAGPGSVDALLDADVIAVTTDSTSMTADAVNALRPVLALAPSHGRRTASDRAIDAFAATGQLARLPISDATPDSLVAALLPLRPPAEAPRTLLRRVLAKVFGTGPAESARLPGRD